MHTKLRKHISARDIATPKAGHAARVRSSSLSGCMHLAKLWHCPYLPRRRGASLAANFSSSQVAAGRAAAPVVPDLPAAKGPVLVWFKHDLRVADNPGLLAATRSGASTIIPFFCLDPGLFCHLALTPAGPAALLACLTRLQADLRALGSDLVVRVGPTHVMAATLARLAGVERVIMEREEESRCVSGEWVSANAANCSSNCMHRCCFDRRWCAACLPVRVMYNHNAIER
eukprot:GHRR01032308.1.p1 GENE.GHRR01032308.1~~GHRR01032308.1.p1  ORF type:complete len:230 (+),score=46.42 GHRR01032308.1:375-1064(+)